MGSSSPIFGVKIKKKCLSCHHLEYMGVSENSGTPKSSKKKVQPLSFGGPRCILSPRPLPAPGSPEADPVGIPGFLV